MRRRRGGQHDEWEQRDKEAGSRAEKVGEDPQVRSLPKPRRRLLSERAQKVLSLERLPMYQLPIGSREAESHGSPSRSEEAASYRGCRAPQDDSLFCSNRFCLPLLSDRMRKRKAFADKELENVMLEREYRERELQELTAFQVFMRPNVETLPQYNLLKLSYNQFSDSSQFNPAASKELLNIYIPFVHNSALWDFGSHCYPGNIDQTRGFCSANIAGCISEPTSGYTSIWGQKSTTVNNSFCPHNAPSLTSSPERLDATGKSIAYGNLNSKVCSCHRDYCTQAKVTKSFDSFSENTGLCSSQRQTMQCPDLSGELVSFRNYLTPNSQVAPERTSKFDPDSFIERKTLRHFTKKTQERSRSQVKVTKQLLPFSVESLLKT
ncbi:uncharacterized protein [Narcine bancroftii]|uniref:uncharacterized protein isoform X3 n=1 Tax=Narcine bancroftii TaxID=1343680 RepID=UPI003831BDD8